MAAYPISSRVEYRQLFEQGIQEFNSGQFFECHDTLEELWFDMRQERKRFVQGLIQASVGVFHASCGNLSAAGSQLARSIEKLEGFRPRFMGIDVERLHLDLLGIQREVARRFHEGADSVELPQLPVIDYLFDPESMADF
jgi:predicted metal-dependent hydrolase